MTGSYDIIVVGAGPGGYVAAIRAAQLGRRVAIIERAHLGGICLNWGCIPTKSLLHGVAMLRATAGGARFGVLADDVRLDAGRMVARSREVSAQLNMGVEYLLRKNKIELIWGQAEIVSPGVVQVTASQAPAPKGALGAATYAADHIILATGASARRLAGMEPDGDRIWSYVEALRPIAIPATLVVVGSGAIGVELASFYAAAGSKVTVVEQQGAVLPLEDAEISQAMAKALARQGIVIATGKPVMGLDKRPDGIAVALSDGSSLAAERLLVAAGVVANTSGLGLERLGVTMRGGAIAADGLGRTGVPGLYAIGDVAGPPMLAHKAEHEGVRCVEAICGQRAEAHAAAPIPSCVFTHPQVASIGLTESAARAAGLDVRIGRFGFRANGKAVVLGETEGMVKTIFDVGTDRLIGAHLIGPDVSELIHGYAVAMGLGATAAQLADIVFPHPTLSEALHEGALAASSRAIHA